MTPTAAETEQTKLGLFTPHPNLSDEINRNIVQSEVEGGVLLDHVPVGVVLEMETTNRFYEMENRGDGRVLISGHPKFCPEPVLVSVHGSTWGRSMLKMRYIGRGMFLEFRHPVHGIIRTSLIHDVREVQRPGQTGRPVFQVA